jgi:integrase/recombinase XerD
MNTKTHAEDLQIEVFTEYLTIKAYSPKTRNSMMNTVKRFSLWSEAEGIELVNITYNDMVAYVRACQKRDNKQSSIASSVKNIKHYYDCLISIKELIENPCTNIDIKGIKRRTLYDTFTEKELDTIYKDFINSAPPNGICSLLTHKRNKIIAGLLIYQGLRTEEIANMKVADVYMREGKIFITGARRTNQREITLEPSQFFDIIDYINETRKLLLTVTGKNTDALFVSMGSSDKLNNAIGKMLKTLRKQHPKIKDAKHFRTSVITKWLKQYNIRKVQYLAGHRFISSTEAYKVNNMDELKEDISRFHPNL